jgi:hypothetical protein
MQHYQRWLLARLTVGFSLLRAAWWQSLFMKEGDIEV